jgi:hypothetical protein
MSDDLRTPSEARARVSGRFVLLEYVGRIPICSWEAQSDEAANVQAGEINRLLNCLRDSLADAARRAGEYAHAAQGWLREKDAEIARLNEENARSLDALTTLQRAAVPLPAVEWTEDDGDVLWWTFPVVEAPFVGTPDMLEEVDEDGLPLHYTHWTPLVVPVQPEGETR